MKKQIYFTDKELIFTSERIPSSVFHWEEPVKGAITRAKILNFFETSNSVVVFTENPEASFARFCREFRVVEAAGGVVQSEAGEVLLIRRNGRWDLPKGHREAGELLEACALRETEEETGVRATQILRKLCETWHAYDRYGPWELKLTHWYLLQGAQPTLLRPQMEEGIEQVRWCMFDEARALISESYPTIREVFSYL